MESLHIGIYKMEVVDGKTQFVRDIKKKEYWSYCADVHIIPPKSDRKRVVLLGESVARGFLLEPDYTPAWLLEILLRTCPGLVNSEVVDLAESDLRMAGLRQRFLESFALQPDLIVLMAGNNWRDDLLAEVELNSSFCDNRGKNVVGPEGEDRVTVVDRVCRAKVTSFIREIGTVGRGKGIPVVFCIPEFNLLDFHSTPGERFVTNLESNRIRNWVMARKAAEGAFLIKNYQVAQLHAAKMIEFDLSHPLGFELLARCKLDQCLYEDARMHLESARDTALYFRTNGKPRIFRVIREAILGEAEMSGVFVIDVAELFKEYLSGGIPGRNLFLDYCHFTVEGIQVVTEAVGTRIAKLLVGKEASLGVRASSIKARPDTVAMAHVLAAIHNAHWGQSSEIMRYHCVEALNASEIAEKMMVHYIDMVSRLARNTVCKSFRELLPLKNMDSYMHALMSPRKLESLEVELVDAMVDALRTTGIDVRNYITRLRQEEHAVSYRRINLLGSHYFVTSYDQLSDEKRAYLKVRDSRSRFLLIARKGDGVRLRLTLRVPGADVLCDPIFINCNDVVLAKVAAGKMWLDICLVVPGAIVVDDVNKIDIIWPLPVENKPANANADDGYYIFGEIHSFTAELDWKNDLAAVG